MLRVAGQLTFALCKISAPKVLRSDPDIRRLAGRTDGGCRPPALALRQTAQSCKQMARTMRRMNASDDCKRFVPREFGALSPR
jgi:hypothetical protein